MKSLRNIMLLAAGVLLLAGIASAADQAKAPALANTDCVKCHAKPPADIEANGRAHKTAVGCQDCHQGHPPTVKRPIPQCSMCHQDKPHFKLAGCLGCHRNPHTPKVITFGRDVTDPCLTCHTPQIAQLKQFPSKHSKLNCSFCHDVHGKIPLCTQCHKSHSADIQAADCKKCHKAHQPKNVVYGADVNSKFCAACHNKPFTLLSASKAKHRTLLCVTCHQDKHKMVPKCQDCHGVPHPQGILNKFGKCMDCHGHPHDLNNWPPPAVKAPATAATAAEPKKEEPKKAHPTKKK
jgi:predicted CXXCH cytochrome family protein